MIKEPVYVKKINVNRSKAKNNAQLQFETVKIIINYLF